MSQPLSREIAIEPAHTALLFVDMQNYNCSAGGGGVLLRRERVARVTCVGLAGNFPCELAPGNRCL